MGARIGAVPGCAVLPVDQESVVVTCSEGWPLAVELLLPPEPRAVAIVGHAIMVNRRTLNARGDGLVGHLAAARIAVWT